jgi:hypothetical protein
MPQSNRLAERGFHTRMIVRAFGRSDGGHSTHLGSWRASYYIAASGDPGLLYTGALRLTSHAGN